jgi:hypothetical protein
MFGGGIKYICRLCWWFIIDVSDHQQWVWTGGATELLCMIEMWALQSMCFTCKPSKENTSPIQWLILLWVCLGGSWYICGGQWAHREVGRPPISAHGHPKSFIFIPISKWWPVHMEPSYLYQSHYLFACYLPKRMSFDGFDYVNMCWNYHQQPREGKHGSQEGVDTRSGKQVNCRRTVVNVAFTVSYFHGEHEVN